MLSNGSQQCWGTMWTVRETARGTAIGVGFASDTVLAMDVRRWSQKYRNCLLCIISLPLMSALQHYPVRLSLCKILQHHLSMS